MKGHYNGVYMKAHKILPGAKTLARILDISPEANMLILKLLSQPLM